MSTVLKILSLIGKGVGILSAMDVTAITPKYGVVIFFVSSLLKDIVNRIGDFLDDGQINQSFKP